MKATIKIIVILIVGVLFVNSYASTTTVYQSTDPLFGAYAEYLNACVLESDKEAIKEYNEDASSLIGLYSAFQGRWHLLKIETVDGSPIDESTMRALEKVTFGCGKDHYVVNGNLTLPWDNMKSLNLDSMRQSHTFVDNYSAFVTYFEKNYSEMGVPVSFDNVKVICTHDCTSSWLKYFSICDFALIGDDYHCCLVINQKYVLWFSQYKVLVTEYALEKYPRDPKDHFFEDPVSDLEGVQIDTKRRIIASDKTCYPLNEWAKNVDITDYYHLIVNDGNRNKYFGRLEELSVTVLPDYKGFHVIYVNCGAGFDHIHSGQLVVYSDLRRINEESDRLDVECNYGGCEDDEAYGEGSCRHLFFDIFEDYTIRVKGRLVDPETGVDKTITRYYRIDDDGQFYELNNNKVESLPHAYTVSLEEAILIFPEATSVESFKDSLFVVKSGSDSLGYVVKTDPYSQAFIGYDGPVPSVIGFTKQWRVKSVVPLENGETPLFFESVVRSGLFKSWDGLTIAEAKDKQVDAVSGATLSSEAAVHSVKSCLSQLDSLGYGKEKTNEKERSRLYPILGMALVLLVLVVIFLKKKKKSNII